MLRMPRLAYMRIAITGGPRTGKTTMAAEWPAHRIRHTDDLIGSHDWSEASAEAATWFDSAESFVIEGVAVPRALRKWLAANPEGKPCDRVYWLTKAHTPLTAGQATMAKGCIKVWLEVLPGLRLRGVEVIDV